jgi:hypothetical protein
MKTQGYANGLQHVVTYFFMLAIIVLMGCDLLSTEDEEEPPCQGDVVLINRLHNTVTTPEKISDPFRECYTYGLIEQRDNYVVGELSESSIHIELNGPVLGTEGARHYYHVITLSAQGKFFFDAELSEITARFTRLDANKLPKPGDKYITGFEMLKIDKANRQISFDINYPTQSQI